jgi:hypothetical protein
MSVGTAAKAGMPEIAGKLATAETTSTEGTTATSEYQEHWTSNSSRTGVEATPAVAETLLGCLQH